MHPLRLWYPASSLRPSSELIKTVNTKLESGQTGDDKSLHLLLLGVPCVAAGHHERPQHTYVF